MNENILKYGIIFVVVVLVAYVVIKNWETLKNISKIEDLRKRLLTTVLFIAVYRLGSHILLPGVDADMLTNLQRQTSSGLLSLLDMFSGGAFSNASRHPRALTERYKIQVVFMSATQLMMPTLKL